MKGKKLLSVVMSAALTLGLTSVKPLTPNVQAEPTYESGEAFDGAIANPDRLIEMLKKNGTIPKDANAAEADKALQQYLNARAIASAKNKSADTYAKQRQALTEQIKANMDSNGIKAGNGSKLGVTKQNTPANVSKEAWNGGQRKDEVLVLLINYPNLSNGKLTPEETDMYYKNPEDYSKQHYQDMIFGKDGYKGPNGETLISMKQFYEQQSGGSYTVDGEVAGWYTAEHEAAYYGGNYPTQDDSDRRPRSLIYEALKDAANDPSVDLNKYDQEDPFDLDGDGNTREPDGLIDHLMVIHSGVGEEAGGGSLGADAIWSHSSNLGGVATIPNTKTDVPYWGGQIGGYAYTVEPEDGAAGVFAHEFGHDLGLPDEYDTLYSGSGEAISYWSIMSSGSWTGKIPGTEPSGFSPYAKEFLQQSMETTSFTPNWQTGSTVDIKNVTSKGTELLLDEASTKGTNNDVVKVNLPDKVTVVNTPFSGTSEYFSGSANSLSNSMSTTVDLTNVKSAQLTFKTWYSIEKDYDYATVQVNGKSIPGNITTTDNPYDANPGNGITGDSKGWIDATFDLSQYAGQTVTLSFNYDTDVAVALPGFFVDDIKVTADNNTLLSDNADDSSSLFTLKGFSKDTGKKVTSQYYLLEWRTHNGSDSGLANVNRKGTMLSYDQGLVVWYVDNSFSDNWTGQGYHPGDGFLGVVDADQHNNIWHYKDWTQPDAAYDINKVMASNSYQMHDAAFSLNKGSDVMIGSKSSMYLIDNYTQNNALFDDSVNYLNPQDPDVGRNIPKFGLKVRVTGQSADGTVGKILLFK